MSATSPTSGPSRARRPRAIPTGSWWRPNWSTEAARLSAPSGGRRPPATPALLRPLAFADLAGWGDDDHAAAFAAFRRGAAVLAEHPPKPRALGIDAAALAACLRRARGARRRRSRGGGAAFFEDAFRARRRSPAGGALLHRLLRAGGRGLADADAAASPCRSTGRRTTSSRSTRTSPRRARPGLPLRPQDRRRAWRTIPTAAAIEAGALAGRGLELVYRRRSGRRLLHPRPGRGAHPPRRGRRDAGHLCRQERPSLHADRPGADRDGRAAEGRRHHADDPRLARRPSRTRRRR